MIPKWFIQSMANDNFRRYPFEEIDVNVFQFAKASHNTFFLDHISEWLKSDQESFNSFMLRRKRPAATELPEESVED
jgi:hypothetical protein